MHQCILVELDALLDTRLATISRIHSDSAVQLLTDDRYYERVIDDFEPMVGITKEAFRNAYAKRDVETLEQSRLTEIPLLLNDLVKRMEQESTTTPFVESLRVEVNIWPYVMSDEERDELALSVMNFTGIVTPVSTVNFRPEELTPQMIKARYSGMILYNLRDWIRPHMETFKRFMMPRVTVLAPALFYDQVPTREDIAGEGMKAELDPFRISEIGFTELFNLNLLRSENFSLVRLDR